ncbi:MAG: hypothetical protein KDA99_26055 [Planctomycetales bacterium]|nr:hypothetical protein [Planctomycetales bacterium]
MSIDEDALVRRAFAAYFRSGGSDQPSGNSGLVMVDGKYYVHLYNGSRTLAVYRVDTSGRLKRLKRWPSEIDEPIFGPRSQRE